MTTRRLLAPELVEGQATPEVIVNEMAAWFDAASLGGFLFIDRDDASPPGSPAEGDCYLVATGATDEWLGEDGNVALFINTAWEFRTPQTGWEAWVEDEAVKIAFDGSSWGIISSFDGADYIPTSDLDTDDTLAANSDSKVASQQAVKTYVDTAKAAAIASGASAADAAEAAANAYTDVAIAGVGSGDPLAMPAEWTPNFSADADLYIPAAVAMTIDEGNAPLGTGSLAYEKSTTAAPGIFSSTTLPATLQAGAWLKVTATGVGSFLAAHLVRTA